MLLEIIRSRSSSSSSSSGSDGEILYAQLINFCNSTKFVMFDVKGVDIKIEIPAPEDFNTIKDRYNLILDGMLLMPTRSTACEDSLHAFCFFVFGSGTVTKLYKYTD